MALRCENSLSQLQISLMNRINDYLKMVKAWDQTVRLRTFLSSDVIGSRLLLSLWPTPQNKSVTG